MAIQVLVMLMILACNTYGKGGGTPRSYFNPVAMFIVLVLKIGACNPHQPLKMKDFADFGALTWAMWSQGT